MGDPLDPNTTAPVTAPPAAPLPATPPAPPNTSEDWQGIPLSDMTDAQKANYWQHYARKHEGTVKAYEGMTPQQVAELKARVDGFEAEKMTADEKAVKAAREEASATAAAAAKAEYLPKLQAAEVKSLASGVISGDQLKSFMSVVNPAAFAGDDGEIDEAKVMGALTGMFGAPQNNRPPAQRWQNAGQFAAPPPAARPGEGGRAEAARRYGTKPNPTP